MLIAALLQVAALGLAWSQQEEAPPAYSDLYTGAYYGAGIQAGPAFLGNDEVDGSIGWAISVEGRLSLLLQLVDAQVDFTHTSLSGDLTEGSFDLANESIAASIGVHPLFVGVLFGEGFGYILSSIYVQWGISAEFSRIDYQGQTHDESWELGQHLGAGFDIPLDLVNDGEAFWLGFGYRHNSVPTAFAPINSASGDFSHHQFLLRFCYRINGQPW